jgi:hypothetical protein
MSGLATGKSINQNCWPIGAGWLRKLLPFYLVGVKEAKP